MLVIPIHVRLVDSIYQFDYMGVIHWPQTRGWRQYPYYSWDSLITNVKRITKESAC